MKVLIVAPYFFERHRWMISAYKTARELAKDHDAVVLTTGKPRFEQMHPRLRVYRMFDIFLPDPVNYSIVPNLAFRLWRVVKKEKPDIFIVNKYMFFTTLAVPLLRIFGKKVITVTDTFPGINWLPRSRFVAFVMRVYAYIIGIPLLWMSNVVILLHEGLLPVAERFHLHARVLHNGVETERYDGVPADSSILHNAEHINIGYVGRLESIKGYYDLVSVAEHLAPTDPRLHFYLVGNTDGKEAYVRQHAGSQIHFLGTEHDTPSIMKTFDIFVLPSYSEGLPNALMNAMYCGLACVATNVGGSRVLLHDGLSGLLFAPGDHQELQDRILRLVGNADERQQLGERARQTIEAGFTWNQIRMQYTKLFYELLSAKA